MKCNKQVINDFKSIHGDIYDYSLMVYNGSKNNIKIICKYHGIFEQRPVHHLRGSGCPHCSKNKKYTNITFKLKSNIIHNNLYDYSLVDYKNAHTNVKIICSKHGIFEQTPQNHIIKQTGCPFCYNENRTLEQSDVLLKFNLIHNNYYDYSQVNYMNNMTKVKIICPKHGVFRQTPAKHLLGQGCPICRESKGEKEIRTFLENNNIKYINQKYFKGCKYKRNLKFDFYLPDYNTCIEYDGKQHFIINEFFDKKEDFETRIKRDQIKNKYCKNNNIQLIRIKYNENIGKKLNFLINI